MEWTSHRVRQSFLDFFAERGHRIVPSAPVIPHGDPTLLFTNAGMNQFKDVFLGQGKRDYTRAADTQKCIRVSGKHNDLEEVGYDTYHHTFFEMLGNWSFGDYYKAEAIAYAWELLTQVWRLPPERLHATVFRTDDEAYELWRRYLPAERIHRFDEKDNFWEMGDTGPCGPCTEIHYDRTPDLSGSRLVNAGTPLVTEVWNLVFIQYNRRADGSLEELPVKHVDTGMGLERICAILQGVDSNYDTDLFVPLIRRIEELSGRRYPREDVRHPDGIAMRVMADHIRALSFAIADGALPGNTGRGYVLRRILRRAERFARTLGFQEPVLWRLVSELVSIMGDPFPELRQHQRTIEQVIEAEEAAFLRTLDRGLQLFEEVVRQVQQQGERVIPGEVAFQLYDTYGFPLDLTQLLARERELTVDTEGFQRLMEEQRQRSRQAQRVHHVEVHLAPTAQQLHTEFTGYEELETESTVLYVEDNHVVLERTPFYVEAGGQVSDTGRLVVGGDTYAVEDVCRVGEAIVHVCASEVEPLLGEAALAQVDRRRRWAIMRNHSATHLLHEALRRVLGPHVQQAGSLVAPDYLRFDFSHFGKVEPAQLRDIEALVNEKIREAIPVETRIMPLEQARKLPNVKMFFADKYGDIVRVVIMDERFSVELCGGTHVQDTGQIGMFVLTAEDAVAAGVRRVEAVTGEGVEQYVEQLRQRIEEQQRYAEQLSEQLQRLQRELERMQLERERARIPEFVARARSTNGIRIVAERVALESMEQLKALADQVRAALGNKGIAVLATVSEGKVHLVCVVTPDLTERYPAGRLVARIAQELGGGGGGRPHLATAGGRHPERLPELFQRLPELIASFGAEAVQA
ncbi:MAG: alanine--tRNA ligase [Candidatus Kapabacteria bacterium]|nr:alanine--tRNA ligase [Candidatus Kapabacteria bacterium]MDW7996222.1 alanine--tRNA ligase [Bacteroidota bacterium]MDW8224622.1 alanine--tRNA ligase [Bacteroidota bacterium]